MGYRSSIFMGVMLIITAIVLTGLIATIVGIQNTNTHVGISTAPMPTSFYKALIVSIFFIAVVMIIITLIMYLTKG